MNKLKEALWNDYNENSAIINELAIGSNECKIYMEENDKIRNELIKVEQIEADKEMKYRQLESDNRNEKIKNGITIVSTLIGLGISVWGIKTTFKFDEGATVTSTLGHGILNSTILKIFKR